MERKKVGHTKRETISESFSVMEAAIDLSVQEEYLNLAKSIDFDNVDYKEVLKGRNKVEVIAKLSPTGKLKFSPLIKEN
jgi:hypothetical protein